MVIPVATEPVPRRSSDLDRSRRSAQDLGQVLGEFLLTREQRVAVVAPLLRRQPESDSDPGLKIGFARHALMLIPVRFRRHLKFLGLPNAVRFRTA